MEPQCSVVARLWPFPISTHTAIRCGSREQPMLLEPPSRLSVDAARRREGSVEQNRLLEWGRLKPHGSLFGGVNPEKRLPTGAPLAYSCPKAGCVPQMPSLSPFACAFLKIGFPPRPPLF